MSKFFAQDEDEKLVFNSADEFTDEQDGQTIHWIIPNAQKNDMYVTRKLDKGSKEADD